MAYVAVSGGEEAIAASIALLDYYRSSDDNDIAVSAIEENMSLLVDRVMSESGLYSQRYAALALKQSEGSVEEAVFLLRAYRSTLSRNYYTHVIDGSDMYVLRRISAAFKDIAGGQMLGASYDYTHRLIDFQGLDAGSAQIREEINRQLAEANPAKPAHYPRVSDSLKEEGLIDSHQTDDSDPFDVTTQLLEFPASRSARLQTMARSDTGFLSGLAYSALRGFGQVHPTVGELRSGYSELYVDYPHDPEESLYIGEIFLTEVECFSSADDSDQLKLSVGYGVSFGRSETKAIAMAVVDYELDTQGPYPAQNEEFVLTHGDSLEMNGFISHLKLPHYVTFQSKLDTVREVKKAREDDHEH